jgi:hypothetical protein
VRPDPAPAAGPPHGYGPAPWPAGFRGIGGHLLRPPPRTEPPPALPAGMTSHGSHLLSPILPGDGARGALCPVCRARALLPPAGGWVTVACGSCGTEFVATDGSPPPPPLPPPAAPSPIAPTSPPEPPAVFPDRARGFTSDVRVGPDGHRRVTCPQCLGAEVLVPDGATVGIVLRCPVCHGPFLVALSGGAGPEEPVGGDIPYEPDRRVWDPCPRCGREALTPERMGRVYVLRCTACGERVTLSPGPYAPRPLSLPAPPSVWERLRRWLGRR